MFLTATELYKVKEFRLTETFFWGYVSGISIGINNERSA